MNATTVQERPRSFRHGVHPEERKEATHRLPIERIPFVAEYVLPLSQHLGAPSVPVVRPGQRVLRGEMIAKPNGFVSVGLHAPVTGEVTAIELRPHAGGKLMQSIVIKTDFYASQRPVFPSPPDSSTITSAEAIALIQNAGMVGMGGAAFPSHVKLKVPEGKSIQIVIINGCECEPYLTCDQRVMVQNPESVVRGLLIFMRLLGVKRGYIGIELNKPDAIEALRAATAEHPSIEVVGLKVKYPQGAEKMLIDAILKREVPSGKLPIDIEIVVQNVATAAAVADLFDHGQPLIDRVLTVSGDGIKRPGNFRVPLGTPLQAVIDHCGGLKPEARQIILGGPMMGLAQKNLAVPVMKGTSGILVLTTHSFDPALEQPCIRCGNCLEACPMFLNPTRLAALVRADRIEEVETYHLMDCFECAACSFVCPSRIPLVQLMRMGKALLREKKKKP